MPGTFWGIVDKPSLVSLITTPCHLHLMETESPGKQSVCLSLRLLGTGGSIHIPALPSLSAGQQFLTEVLRSSSPGLFI